MSDTHLPRGPRRLPDACRARLARADLILHAGDIATAGVLCDLEAIGPPVVAVRGNVDEAKLGDRLPECRQVPVGGVLIGMVHDAGPARGRLERMRRAFPEAAAVIFGHSHIPLHETAGHFHIFNPGSPTDPRRQPAPTMGMLRIGGSGQLAFEHVALGADAGVPPAQATALSSGSAKGIRLSST